MATTVIITEPDRNKLYKRIKNLLGAPLRSVELEDEMMDSLLELSIQDYAQHVNDWLIESQWTSLAGLNLDEQSLTRAFTTRSLDYETQFTYAYSKTFTPNITLRAAANRVLSRAAIQAQALFNQYSRILNIYNTKYCQT